MRKIVAFILIALFILAFAGYLNKNVRRSSVMATGKDMGTNASNSIKRSAKLKISWEFESTTKRDGKDSAGNDIEYPYTCVYLVLDGVRKEKMLIGSYMGAVNKLDDLSDRDFPSDTILACEAYYAGAGDDICVLSSKGKLIVKWRAFDEPAFDDQDYSKPKFKTIKTISVPENSNVEVNE